MQRSLKEFISRVSSIYLERGPNRIGRVYKKAMYRQYTNASYTLQAPRPEWLGYLGPVIMAEVDEVIVVHLRNMASRNYSIHPHGVFYKKENEGALYPDGTSGRMKLDDSVPPGGNYTYRWEVRPEFGPTQDDANCLTWAYHSHVSAPNDIAAGLVGGLLTCKQEVYFGRTAGRIGGQYLKAVFKAYTDSTFTSRKPWDKHMGIIGKCVCDKTRYKKVVYREFTDETFNTPRTHSPQLGIMGPLIKAEVGEQVLIMFKNKASRPYSIHAHGIQKSSRYPRLNPVQPGEQQKKTGLEQHLKL
ncbi:unnamed protein product [Lota lota]